jgi:hypothetical protein
MAILRLGLDQPLMLLVTWECIIGSVRFADTLVSTHASTARTGPTSGPTITPIGMNGRTQDGGHTVLI